MGLWGDEIIVFFFKVMVMFGLDWVSIMVLGMKKKDFFKLWVEVFCWYFGKDLGDKKEKLVGKVLIIFENGGWLNIVFEISFNG